MSDVRRSLAAAPLFRDLDARQLKRLEQMAVVRSFEDGTEILREGEEAAVVFLITSGYVDVTRGTSYIATLGPGACVGEMAVADHSGRSTTVTANGPVDALAIRGWDFMAEVRANPGLTFRLMHIIADRVRSVDEALSVQRKIECLAGWRTGFAYQA